MYDKHIVKTDEVNCFKLQIIDETKEGLKMFRMSNGDIDILE